MNEDKRLKLRAEQMRQLYEKIGKFVVKFEHVCHQMQLAITFMMHSQGLNNQRVAQIILAGHTADPLRTLFESLIGELKKLNTKEEEIVKNILSRIKNLIEIRNDIVHCTWYIGWGNEQTQDFSEASGYRLHKNKQGVKFKFPKYNIEKFSEHIIEAEKLAILVARLSGCFISNFSVEKNFRIDASGNVVDLNEVTKTQP